MKYGAFEKKLEKKLDEWFNLKGYFKKESDIWRYIKETDLIKDYIHIYRGNQSIPKMNCVQVSSSRKIKKLEGLFQEFLFQEGGLDITFSISPGQLNRYYSTRKCFSPETDNDVELAMEHIIYEMDNLLIPEMNRLSDIKVLNALENQTLEHNGFIHGNEFWPRKLTLAWAAQDHRYEELYQSICDMYIRIIDSHDEYEKEYIKEFKAIKELYVKLNGLPKFENAFLL